MKRINFGPVLIAIDELIWTPVIKRNSSAAVMFQWGENGIRVKVLNKVRLLRGINERVSKNDQERTI